MRHTRRLAWTLGLAAAVLTSHPDAQTPTPQPRFKGGTDLVQVDVSVLDGKRRPVRGLTAADFVLLEDGQPRDIQAFTEVYLPDRVRAKAAPWVRDVPSDVVTNQASEQEGRLVIILLDRTIPVGPPTVLAKKTASAIVEQLGPADLAAVVSTGAGDRHNLTSDRSRLLRAIEHSDVSTGVSEEAREIEAVVFGNGGAPSMLSSLSDGRCLCGLCVLETITGVADALQSTERRRKVLFFIGSDLTLQAMGKVQDVRNDIGCEMRLKDARNAMFAAIDRANLTVHSLDPSGLNLVTPVSRPSSTLMARDVAAAITRSTNEHLQRQGALTVLPDRTGGRTVLNTNTPDMYVGDIFRESDSYYLIGFRPSQPEAAGKAHSLEVKTKREGLRVHARNSYTSGSVAEAASASTDPRALPAPLRASLSGLLPTSDLSLDMNAATFATPGSSKSIVALTVGVGAFVSSPAGAMKAKSGVPLEIVASAYDRGGRPQGVARQTIDLSWPQSTGAQEARFDALSRLDLPPGEYELRIGISGGEPARTASIFSYVTVPPFDSAPLSLSSIVLEATAGTLTAPADFLKGALPIVPTARREFATTDTLVSFLRIYQGTSRRDALLPVTLRSSVLDAQGGVVASQSSTLTAAAFEKDRSADHYLELPLTKLVAGDYLLRIETEMGKRTAGRALRFTVR